MMILVDYAMNQVDYDIDMGIKDNGVKEPVALEEGTLYGFNMGGDQPPTGSHGQGAITGCLPGHRRGKSEWDLRGRIFGRYVITFNA